MSTFSFFAFAVLASLSTLGADILPGAMERLPPGSVRPAGWLLKQMEMQRVGLTGRAEELYLDIGKSDWLTGRKQFLEKGEGEGMRLAVKAVRTGYAGWGSMRMDAPARAEDPPPSPVPASAAEGPVETIELVPIAFTQLRMTFLPWTSSIQMLPFSCFPLSND